MSLVIGFLTFVMVMNCLFLMLLILIQLPKKEAGAGIAFGGGATDALFGAGSGTALTKLTKYSASLFVGLSILLSVLNMHAARQGTRRLEQELSKSASAATPVLPTTPAVSPSAQVTPQAPPVSNAALQTTPALPNTNLLMSSTPAAPSTNLVISSTTNQAATPAPVAPANPATTPATPPATTPK